MINVNTIKQNLINIPGWRINRKIVVFESDDWGSIRTRSKKSLDRLRRYNIKVDNCHYMLNDSLASESDLNELFNVLQEFNDINGNHPILTANCLVTNPDFKKIKASDFSKYYYESFIETLKKYPEHSGSFDLWKEGMDNDIFHPQSHGREHLNVSRWMQDLKKDNAETKIAFDLEMFGISTHVLDYKRSSYQSALDGGLEELQFDRTKIIEDALNYFENNFGYRSESFIAPNYIWDNEIEEVLMKNGVNYIQSSTAQFLPIDFGTKRKIKRHYLGQKNKLGQRYLMRNCHFEPSENQNKEWVNSCLKEIEIAFRWNKPAIISTHRVNYIGFINPKNRNANIPQLKELLSKMLKRWPDIEFMTSDQLGNLITSNGK